MLSLSELAKIHKKKLKSKTKTYDVILNKCFTQIKNMAQRDQTFCYYVVPLYVLGLPIYDINSCLVYILLNLKKKGFMIQMSDYQTIYISWKHIYEAPKKQKQQQIQQHKKIQPPSVKTTNNNTWQQQNQRFLPQRQSITYNKEPSTRVDRFIEHSNFLL